MTASAQQSLDAETETLIAVAHALRGEGHDASEDGTGRGTPIIAIQERAVSENPDAGPGGAGYSTEGAAYTLEARHHVQAVAMPLTAGMAASASRMPHEQGALVPVAFDCKGSQVQTDESGVAPTLRAMTHADSHQNGGGQIAVAFAENQRGEVRTSDVALQLTTGGGKAGQGFPAVAIQERAVSENPEAGPQGAGFNAEGAAYTLEARNKVQAVAFDCKGAEVQYTTDGAHPTLRSMGHNNSHQNVGGHAALALPRDNGESHAGTQEADPGALLRALRDAVGAQAFAEWGSGILDPLQSPEVLRSWLHGERVRREASKAGPELDDSALARAQGVPAGAMQRLWQDGPDGRSPQGRELAKQLARELGTALPILPPQGAPWAVRRLTPKEAERLQGFPDGYTDVPYRGRAVTPDGPRYKALGNSMAVNCMSWIGERIALVEGL